MTLTVRYRLPRPARTADGGPGSPHVAPGAARTGNSPTGPKATRLARQLALSYEIDRLVEDGALTHAEAALQIGVTRARITQPDREPAVAAGLGPGADPGRGDRRHGAGPAGLVGASSVLVGASNPGR